ncbi:hypothetical protein B5S31_g1985 [[Candida] boidinii]|nr:hypothetical protein B5S31_g1985 [[Candida] boidinii]
MSSSESESNSEDEFKFESIIATRQRRSNAGSRLRQLLQLEEDEAESNLLNGSSARNSNFATEDDENVELLFQEDGEDEEFVDYDEDGDDEQEEEEDKEDNEDESEPNKMDHDTGEDEEKEQTETTETGENDNEEEDDENVNSDEMLSDSDISGSDSDESEGERELQKQEKLKKRKRKAADFIPTIKKPTVPTAAGTAPKTKTVSPRKKPQASSQMTADMLLNSRRSSTRKSTIANTIATAKRVNESEERKKQYAINSSKIQKVETVEKTLEEHLAEAIETERQNVESLNRFFEQEVEKKKKQRDLQNSKKRKLTEFLRFHSFGDYVTPVIELAEQKRIDDLIAKQREIELAKLKKKRKYPRKKKTLTPTPTPTPETVAANNENGSSSEPKKDIDGVSEIQNKENGESTSQNGNSETINKELLSSTLVENGESKSDKVEADIPEQEKSDLKITDSKETEQLKSEPPSTESKINEEINLIEKVDAAKTEETKIEETKTEETKIEETKIEETKIEEATIEETNFEPVELAEIEKPEIGEIKGDNNTQAITLPVSEISSENGKVDSDGDVDMKESTPTPTENGQADKDNNTAFPDDNNTDQDADMKDTIQVKIEKMDDELSKIDGSKSDLVKQNENLSEEKDGFQEVKGDAKTAVSSSVDVEMVDINEISKDSQNKEEVTEENESQDIKTKTVTEKQENAAIKSEESELKSDLSPTKRVTFADDTKTPESDVKEVPVISEENKTVTDANGTAEEKLENTTDIKDEDKTAITTDPITEDGVKEEEIIDEGPVYEGPPQFVAVNYISFEEFPNDLNQDQVKEYLFSKDALLPGARRSVHVERLFTIKHDDSTSTDAKLQNSSKEREKQFKELLLLPKFGETVRTQEKVEVEEEVEEEEIKIITPSPVGIYLPDGKRKKCPISGRLSQYFDPQSGIPYNSVDSFRILRDVQDDMYYWAQIDNGGPESDYKGGIGVYMNKWNGRNAKGVPEGF